MYLDTDKESGAALICFKGAPGIIEIQNLLLKGIDMVKAEKCDKAVIDTSQLEVMFTLSLYWYRKEWYPLAHRSGLKSVAVVFPESFAQQRFLERLNKQATGNGPITFGFYTSRRNALDWLRER